MAYGMLDVPHYHVHDLRHSDDLALPTVTRGGRGTALRYLF